MKKETLGDWIRRERAERGWNRSDFAREAGLYRQTIYALEKREFIPEPETLLALSRVFNTSLITLYRKVGLLPEASPEEILFDDWKHLLAQMDPEDEQELRMLAKYKVEKRQKKVG